MARSSGTAGRSSGLGAPPADGARLERFPQAPTVRELHRLSEHPEPWFFSSVDDVEQLTGGRFDLIAPDGSCYLAESLEGCLVEKLLRGPTRVVVAERLDELFHTTVRTTAPMRTADLTAARASGFGVNAEIHSTLDPAAPRRWAIALRAAGFRALRHALRADPAATLRGRAVFGTAGLHRRAPAGLATRRVTTVDVDVATRALAARGVRVLPIPHDVPLV